jgi:hypothetical protein
MPNTAVRFGTDPKANQPYHVGSAKFATGQKFTITREAGQGKGQGGFKITDKDGNKSYAGSLAKAWASIRYMAKIIDKTERSSIG